MAHSTTNDYLAAVVGAVNWHATFYGISVLFRYGTVFYSFAVLQFRVWFDRNRANIRPISAAIFVWAVHNSEWNLMSCEMAHFQNIVLWYWSIKCNDVVVCLVCTSANLLRCRETLNSLVVFDVWQIAILALDVFMWYARKKQNKFKVCSSRKRTEKEEAISL